MAAQAGVRYSILHPQVYMDSNLQGFITILECCRKYPVNHLLFASSSSVYGLNRKMPYSEHDSTEHPVSLYGATKKANELMAHAYAQLYGIPATGLRLFTVYGPYGRPDMSPMIFSRKILQDEVLDVFNHGRMERDFTYIDDVVEGISRLISKPPATNPGWDAEKADPQSSSASYRILNVGYGRPQRLEVFIDLLSDALGRKARRKGLPMQKGDVHKTFSDTGELQALTGFKPRIDLEEGIKRFVRWYREYYAT
jgi:UDP-glucuronate 4-epimerase